MDLFKEHITDRIEREKSLDPAGFKPTAFQLSAMKAGSLVTVLQLLH